MKSLLDERLGAQEPIVMHRPPGVVSLAAAEEAIELADAYGVCDGNPLSESQKITLRNGLGERADGSWAATRIADFGPRQGTGKNDKIAARELAGLILFNEQLQIHTAHEFPTANESFLRLVSVFENWDDLRKKVARIRYANGEQGIELLTGQRLKYRARTGGSGRGFAKADLVVYDEAQHLQAEHVAASGPAKMANPNSQTWYAGSGGLATSKVAWAIRRAALHGTGGRLAYTEMTGEILSVVNGIVESIAPDPTDREVWYRCIPGLGRWVTEEAVEALYGELDDLFPREILCVWEPDPDGDAGDGLPFDLWTKLEQPTALAGQRAVAVAVSLDRSRATIGVCGTDPAGFAYLDVVEAGVGTTWVVERIQKLGLTPVVLDASGPAGSLVADFTKAGIEVKPVSSREYGGACGALFDAVIEGTVKHSGAEPLNDAVRVARRKQRGDVWVWHRTLNDDVSPLEAVTLARWAHTGTLTPTFEALVAWR